MCGILVGIYDLMVGGGGELGGEQFDGHRED